MIDIDGNITFNLDRSSDQTKNILQVVTTYVNLEAGAKKATYKRTLLSLFVQKRAILFDGFKAYITDTEDDGYSEVHAALESMAAQHGFKQHVFSMARDLELWNKKRAAADGSAFQAKWRPLTELISEVGEGRLFWLEAPPVLFSSQVPNNYLVDPSGIAQIIDGEAQLICTDPIFITGVTRYTNNEEYMSVSFYSRGEWRGCRVPRAMLFDHTKIVVALASAGMAVSSVNAMKMLSYFVEYEVANRSVLPVEAYSRTLGWVAKGSGLPYAFILPQRCIGGEVPIKFEPTDASFQQLGSAVTTAGDFETWKAATHAAMCEYKWLSWIITGAFASVALAVTITGRRANSFIMDISGARGTGKSTALKGAASVWGYPSDSDGIIHKWGISADAANKTLATMHSLPVFFDESQLARDKPEQLQSLVYAVGSNQAPMRGSPTGLQEMLKWLLVVVSTGETRLTNLISQRNSGAEARVLCYNGLVLERSDSETKLIAEQLETVWHDNHGHAGPMFVEFLLENRHRWSAWATEMETTYTALDKPFYGSTCSRLTRMISVLVVTNRIMREAGMPYGALDENDVPLWVAPLRESMRTDTVVTASWFNTLRKVQSRISAYSDRIIGTEAFSQRPNSRYPIGSRTDTSFIIALSAWEEVFEKPLAFSHDEWITEMTRAKVTALPTIKSVLREVPVMSIELPLALLLCQTEADACKV